MPNHEIPSHYDPMGLCVYDYWKGREDAALTVLSSLDEPTQITGEYLFRDFDSMPELEQIALQLCRGKILDVGACSGCHAVVLQEKELDVTAIDISLAAVNTLRERGIKTIHEDIFVHTEAYDTILLLMNGMGMGGTPENTVELLSHLKTILKPGGQIIGDSADIIEAYREEDGSVLIELTGKYYGQLEYVLEYNGKKGEQFNWLYIDFDLLTQCANQAGLSCQLVAEGETDNFLCVLQHL